MLQYVKVTCFHGPLNSPNSLELCSWHLWITGRKAVLLVTTQCSKWLVDPMNRDKLQYMIFKPNYFEQMFANVMLSSSPLIEFQYLIHKKKLVQATGMKRINSKVLLRFWKGPRQGLIDVLYLSSFEGKSIRLIDDRLCLVAVAMSLWFLQVWRFVCYLFRSSWGFAVDGLSLKLCCSLQLISGNK